ncbi:MAG: 4Fe-4S binding protein [Chloroflexi bacterium]|nr:4Fe-4S binding protein [Chloroflexota bacterium]
MEVNRRELLGLLRPRWNPVPTVAQSGCTATWGCRVCVPSCPRQALVEKDGVVAVDERLCDGCGCCSLACPWGALRVEGCSPREIDRLLTSGLSRETKAAGAGILLLYCKGAEERLEDDGGIPGSVAPIRLPCLAKGVSYVLLRAFELGARGVALLPCGGDCRYGFNLEETREEVGFIRAVMARAGLSQDRLRVLDSGPRRELREMEEGLSERGVAPPPAELRNKPFPLASLVIAGLLQKDERSPRLSLEGKAVPCGLVEVQPERCSLCGLCARMCLSRALAMEKREGKLFLVFHHAFCAACGECVRVCPDGALKLQHGLDTRLLGEPQVLVEARLAQCRLCGKNITAAPMLRKIQSSLASSGLELEDSLNLCPACRMQHLLSQRSPLLKKGD